MRKAFVLASLVVLTMAMTIQAAVPQTINYQGYLTDSEGPVTASNLWMDFFIYDAPTGGNSKWAESHQFVDVTDGLFNVILGAGTQAEPIEDTVFSGADRWLQIVVSGEEITPRTKLTSKPYAFRVSTVDGASGGNITGKLNVGLDNHNSGSYAFVAGLFNTASGANSRVGGGGYNTASGLAASVDGGQFNTASGSHSTVGGGIFSTAIGDSSTVAGGAHNSADGVGSTIGGGIGNNVTFDFGTVSGGEGNTAAGVSVVAGGFNNNASNQYASIGGGQGNVTLGAWAAIPGGKNNKADGIYSFAAGRRAKANHSGTFVWGDSFDGDITSTTDNQFTARTTGGARFFTSTDLTTGVTLAAGGGAWAPVSDRNVKENIRPVDGADILKKISQLDISRWNYVTQDESIEHIGPMAQDFYELFGVGDNNTTITTIDPDGISLAAIKALYDENKKLKARLEKLEESVKKLSEK
jgi:hypothetical protein